MKTVTDEDVRAAWDAFFARPKDLAHVELLTPEAVPESHITMTALRNVLETDRRRVAVAEAKTE